MFDLLNIFSSDVMKEMLSNLSPNDLEKIIKEDATGEWAGLANEQSLWKNFCIDPKFFGAEVKQPINYRELFWKFPQYRKFEYWEADEQGIKFKEELLTPLQDQEQLFEALEQPIIGRGEVSPAELITFAKKLYQDNLNILGLRNEKSAAKTAAEQVYYFAKAASLPSVQEGIYPVERLIQDVQGMGLNAYAAYHLAQAASEPAVLQGYYSFEKLSVFAKEKSANEAENLAKALSTPAVLEGVISIEKVEAVAQEKGAMTAYLYASAFSTLIVTEGICSPQRLEAYAKGRDFNGMADLLATLQFLSLDLEMLSSKPYSLDKIIQFADEKGRMALNDLSEEEFDQLFLITEAPTQFWSEAPVSKEKVPEAQQTLTPPAEDPKVEKKS